MLRWNQPQSRKTYNIYLSWYFESHSKFAKYVINLRENTAKAIIFSVICEESVLDIKPHFLCQVDCYGNKVPVLEMTIIMLILNMAIMLQMW